MEHRLRTRMRVSRPRGEVFRFFADAGNLARITPPELGFEMMTPVPIEMRAGSRIEYRLRLYGVPIRWLTEITIWEPDDGFVDVQLRGPYRLWVHEHRFRGDGAGGTVIEDEVRYRLPFFPLGELAWPLVRVQLGRIFRYRKAALARLLASAG